MLCPVGKILGDYVKGGDAETGCSNFDEETASGVEQGVGAPTRSVRRSAGTRDATSRQCLSLRTDQARESRSCFVGIALSLKLLGRGACGWRLIGLTCSLADPGPGASGHDHLGNVG